MSGKVFARPKIFVLLKCLPQPGSIILHFPRILLSVMNFLVLGINLFRGPFFPFVLIFMDGALTYNRMHHF